MALGIQLVQKPPEIGTAETNGAVQYDLDEITSAKKLIDLLLVKTERL